MGHAPVPASVVIEISDTRRRGVRRVAAAAAAVASAMLVGCALGAIWHRPGTVWGVVKSRYLGWTSQVVQIETAAGPSNLFRSIDVSGRAPEVATLHHQRSDWHAIGRWR